MALAEGLKEIAQCLLREAHHRESHAKLKTGEWECVSNFCLAVRHLAFQSWLELKFIGAVDGKDLAPDPYEDVLFRPTAYGRELKHIQYREDGSCYVAPGGWRPPNSRRCIARVTVYFGSPRGVGMKYAAPATIEHLSNGEVRITRPKVGSEKRKKLKKEIRVLLKQAQRNGWTRNQVMYVDTRSSARHIQEQLAIFLIRVGIWDESTKKLLGLGSEDTLKRATASKLVTDFVDPGSPASYPAYKRKLLFNIVGPEEAVQALPTCDQIADESESSEGKADVPYGTEPISAEVRQIRGEHIEAHLRRGRGARIPCDSYSVREAAKIIGTSWRNLYVVISANACSYEHDRFGRIRIPLAELSGIREEVQNHEKSRAAYRSLIDWLVKTRNIQKASARRYVNRAIEKGKSLKQIYFDAGGKPPQSGPPP